MRSWIKPWRGGYSAVGAAPAKPSGPPPKTPGSGRAARMKFLL